MYKSPSVFVAERSTARFPVREPSRTLIKTGLPERAYTLNVTVPALGMQI
jgi:hypothetical protein